MKHLSVMKHAAHASLSELRDYKEKVSLHRRYIEKLIIKKQMLQLIDRELDVLVRNTPAASKARIEELQKQRKLYLKEIACL